MGQIIVRNLDDAVIAKLKTLASANNTSLEQTVRDILSAVIEDDREAVWAAIDAAREAQKPSPVSSTDFIREDRDRR